MMSKQRLSGGVKEENYEHVLMCLICRSLFDDYDHQPKFLPCHHTFCKDCLREYVRQAGDEIECPSCRKTATIPTAGVVALQTNFYVKYIQSLVYGPGCTGSMSLECDIHPKSELIYYCKECSRSICSKCCDSGAGYQCADHKKILLTALTEEYSQKLHCAFSKANSVIERKRATLEGMMKALSEEKDQTMKMIDSTFEQHIHTVTRRTTLLKNKVIAIYNEHVDKLEADMEEVSTAMTCIVSLKEYHEDMIGKGYFMDTQKGITEMDEVFTNINTHIQPKENHIVYEDKHGLDKYKASVKDLGRVRNSRPTQPRAEPEGVDCVPTGLRTVGSDTTSPSQTGLSAFSPDIQGAVGGSDIPDTGIFSSLGAGACSGASKEEQPGRRDADDRVPSSRGQAETASSIKTRCDSSVRAPTGTHSSQPNAHGHSLLENTKLDINSNTPITIPGVVRPKTLTRPLPTISTSSSEPKDSVQNGLVKSRDAPHEMMISGAGGPMRMSADGLSPAGLATLSALHRSDPGPQMYALSTLNMDDNTPNLAIDPEIESLRQTDKMYHHLVYTSYDEEELLKELKCGKAHFDPMRAPSQKQSSMEDSDSMMTVSSESTLSGNSDDLTVSDEQSRL